MFEVVVAMKTVGTFGSFGEAFKVFFNKVKELVEQGVSFNVLETACWIKHNNIPMYFYNVRDLAYEVGVLRDEGQLVDPLPKFDPYEVDLAFARQALAVAEEFEDEVRVIDTLLKLSKTL